MSPSGLSLLGGTPRCGNGNRADKPTPTMNIYVCIFVIVGVVPAPLFFKNTLL